MMMKQAVWMTDEFFPPVSASALDGSSMELL